MKRNCHLYGLILAPKHQRHSGPLIRIRIRIRSTFFIPKEILFVARLQSIKWKWPRWNNHCMVPLDRLTPDLLHRSWWPRESHQSQLPPAAAPDPLISATALEHVSDVTAAKVKHQNSAKSGLPATPHPVDKSAREAARSPSSPTVERQDALQTNFNTLRTLVISHISRGQGLYHCFYYYHCNFSFHLCTKKTNK